jgi:hypothetical protein
VGVDKLVTHYLLPHFPKLRAVVIEIHLGHFNLDNGDANWLSTMERTKGYQYDNAHGFWTNEVPPALDSIMRAYVNPFTTTFADTLGSVVLLPPATLWDTTSPTEVTRKPWTPDDPVPGRTIAYLDSIVQKLRSQRIHAVLVVIPQSRIYKKATYYGRYGPPWPLAKGYLDQVEALCAQGSYCTFYDAYNYGNHDYPDSVFYNGDHLAYPGAVQLSQRLDSLMWHVVGPGP